MDPEELVTALLRPEAYPWHPPAVELVETHISWVFLAGDRVVKIKRPVVYPFVDHTTLASRHQSCIDEARLNRRLTDAVYLDVVPIILTAEGCRVDGAGLPSEWATLMRRLPAAGMLDALLRAGMMPCHLSDRLAARLIPFHRERAPCCGITPEIAFTATRIVTDNLGELAPFVRAPLGPVQFGLVAEAMRQFLSSRHELFRQRAAAGWIRDGHGDLRAEHVCLEPGGPVQIFDCVEFSHELRCADVASDLAFLLMDLTRLGAPQTAAALLARYRDVPMELPDELLRFYWTHRALVRCKIACLKRAGADAEAIESLAVTAADYLDLASASAVSIQPMLVAMSGLSGTGKSTVASRLARALSARLYASDVVRKDLAGVEGAAPAAWREGIYHPGWTRLTYDRLFTLAEEHLAAGGGSVVLDAAFLSAEQRVGAAAVAARRGVPFVLIETVCDATTVTERLATRAAREESASDATMGIYLQQRAAVTEVPPPVPRDALVVRVGTASRLPVSVDPVFAALVRRGILQPVVPSAPACPSVDNS